MKILGTAIAPGSAAKTEAELWLDEQGGMHLQLPHQQVEPVPESETGSEPAAEIETHQQPQADIAISAWVTEVHIAAELGSVPRSCKFPDGWSFVPHSNTQLNQWLQAHQKRSWLPKLEGDIRLALAALVVTAIVLWGTVVHGLPAASGAIAGLVPSKVNQHLGEQSLKSLQHVFTTSQLPLERQNQIKALFNRQAEQMSFPEGIEPRLLFRHWQDPTTGLKKKDSLEPENSPEPKDSPERDNSPEREESSEQQETSASSANPPIQDKHAGIANAFALPDGTVLITDAMVHLADSDAQVAAVLLHELGHVQYNHGVEQLVQGSLMAILVSLVFGDVTGMSELLLSGASFGVAMKYSRDAENEADEFAVPYMLKEYRSIEPMVQVFTKLEDSHSHDGHASEHQSGESRNDENEEEDQAGLSWLSSHPQMQERIEAIRQHARELGAY